MHKQEPDAFEPLEVSADAQLAAIVDSSFDAIISKDLNSVITTWNPAAERLFGYSAAEAIGRSILFLIPENRRDEEAAIIARVRKGERVETYETVRLRRDGTAFPVSLTVSPIKGRDGRIVGASKILRDISAAKENERRISLLLREVHHRVKNNLQTVASLVRLQQQMPEEVKQDLHSRIMAIAAVHEHLHNQDTFEAVQLEQYLRWILEGINASYGSVVRLDLDLEPVRVDPDTAVTLGLITNELITNSNKYAFPDRPAGMLGVRLSANGDGTASLSIFNDGISFDADARAEGTGIRLIRGLAATLDPRYVLDGSKGLDFRMSFAALD